MTWVISSPRPRRLRETSNIQIGKFIACACRLANVYCNFPVRQWQNQWSMVVIARRVPMWQTDRYQKDNLVSWHHSK
jgi:hypothetical protein